MSDNPEDPGAGRWHDRLLGPFAAIILAVIVAVTFVDVIGRYLLNAPVPGAYEAVSLGMALLVFAGLPLVTAREQHLTVSLLDHLLSPRMRRAQRLAVTAVSLIVTVALARCLWLQARDLTASGERFEVVTVPIGIVAYFMTVMTALAGILLVILLVRLVGETLGRRTS